MVVSSRKKRVAIIISWLLFLVVLSVCFFALERNIYSKTAQKELLEQAVAVNRQITPIVENDYFTLISAFRVEAAKLKTLAFALEGYDDIEQAKPFLDDFYRIASISGLFVYDREGNVLYKQGVDTKEKDLTGNGEAISQILDTELYNLIEEEWEVGDEDIGYLMSTETSIKIGSSYFWGVGKRWLITMEDSISSAQAYVREHFSKNRVMQSITIGKTGFLVTISQKDGTVINSHRERFDGKHMKELGIKAEQDISTVEDLNSLFYEPSSVIQIEMDGESYYANRLNLNEVLVLVMLPVSEIDEHVSNSTITLIILVVLISGLAVTYAFFHADDADDGDFEVDDGTVRGRSFWNRTMAGKMRIVGILSVIGVFAGVVYLESLSLYADTFSYTESKVNKIVLLLGENDVAMEMLQKWCDDDALTRSRMAKCIIDHTDPDKVDWEYLSKLSEMLGVEYIYRFDKDGNIVATNSPLDRIQVREGSDLYPLLEGKPDLVLPPAKDAISGLYLQNAGIAIRDENMRSDGFLMVSLNPTELSKVRENFGFKYTFEQLGLSNGAYVFAVTEKDMTIDYLAFVMDDGLKTDVEAYEYTGTRVSDLGIDEKIIRDNFNGNVFLFDNTFFASIQRVDDIYYIVMRPLVRLGVSNVVFAAFATGVSLLFMVVLTFLSALKTEKAQESKPEGARPKRSRTKAHKDMDLLAMFGQLFEKKKPYFEDRWPNDSKKWKDRTAGEKFTATSEYLILAVLLFVYLHAKLAGSSSIWYYCVTGKWESGINLYSVTSCILSICLLIIIKIVVHKLFYLTARAVSSRGETICHLMDNFSGYALVIAGIFICLHHFGVNATALSLTGGIAGVIFGLGCQNMVADILSGLIMAFSGEVRVGDFVSYNGNYGTILSIGIRTTKLMWFGEVTLVRNNEFKNVVLFGSKERRVVSTINIDLKESLEKVEKVVEKELPVIHENLQAKVSNPINGPMFRGVDSISQDCVTISFFLFCKGSDFIFLMREMNKELKKMCERNDINLAMHQVVVNEPEDYIKK